MLRTGLHRHRLAMGGKISTTEAALATAEGMITTSGETTPGTTNSTHHGLLLGPVDTVRALLEAGADVNKRN